MYVRTYVRKASRWSKRLRVWLPVPDVSVTINWQLTKLFVHVFLYHHQAIQYYLQGGDALQPRR